jgi:chromosome segregation ATPase
MAMTVRRLEQRNDRLEQAARAASATEERLKERLEAAEEECVLAGHDLADSVVEVRRLEELSQRLRERISELESDAAAQERRIAAKDKEVRSERLAENDEVSQNGFSLR